VCVCLQLEDGIVLQVSDKKTRGFLILIAFNRLFSEHVRKMFDEMTVST
jgi:hypothetical protein